MIRRLRVKVIAICMALVTAVLAVVLGLVYVSAQESINDLSRQMLRRAVAEEIRPTIGPGYGDGQVLLPYFTVTLWQQGGQYTAYPTGGTYEGLENSRELEEILRLCLSQEEAEGKIPGYSLRYLRLDNGLYTRIAFVDTSMEQASVYQIMLICLRMAAAALVLALGISWVLSWWITRPVERAWTQQKQFLSDASHELKTPLTVILSNAELLEGAALEEREARWADHIHAEARRMKSLVERMLTLARADRTEQTKQTRPAAAERVNLTDLAADCVLAFEPVAYEAGKPLSDVLAPEVTVAGNPEGLRQVLGVLLDNAIKYGKDGGEITVTLEKTDRSAKLTVANPGEPIPPAQLKHLFERFYRADASRGEQQGFGLGLPIAAAIVREHKGTLKAESDAVSTRFTVTLPLKR